MIIRSVLIMDFRWFRDSISFVNAFVVEDWSYFVSARSMRDNHLLDILHHVHVVLMNKMDSEENDQVQKVEEDDDDLNALRLYDVQLK